MRYQVSHLVAVFYIYNMHRPIRQVIAGNDSERDRYNEEEHTEKAPLHKQGRAPSWLNTWLLPWCHHSDSQ